MTDAPALHRGAVDPGARRQSGDEVGDGLPAEAFDATADQLAKDGRRRLCVTQRGVDRLDLYLQRLHEAGQSGRLAGRQLEHQAPERRRVHHRVLERPGQPAAENPGVEGVVAVLDEHGSAGEVEQGPPRVTELWCVDEHLALDQVPPLGVRIDRRPGVDQGVEQAERPAQPEPLGADLEHEEGPVSGRLDVHRHELGLLQG